MIRKLQISAKRMQNKREKLFYLYSVIQDKKMAQKSFEGLNKMLMGWLLLLLRILPLLLLLIRG
jgi:hypothetical protein